MDARFHGEHTNTQKSGMTRTLESIYAACRYVTQSVDSFGRRAQAGRCCELYSKGARTPEHRLRWVLLLKLHCTSSLLSQCKRVAMRPNHERYCLADIDTSLF